MTVLGALLLAATGTYLLRVGSVVAFTARPLAPTVSVILRHAALAVMGSIAVASLPGEGPAAVSDLPNVAGIVAAVVAARRGRSTVTVIGIAVAVSLLLEHITR